MMNNLVKDYNIKKNLVKFLSASFLILSFVYISSVAIGILKPLPVVTPLISVSALFVLVSYKFMTILPLIMAICLKDMSKWGVYIAWFLICWIILHYIIGYPFLFEIFTQQEIEQFFGVSEGEYDRFFNIK